MTELWELLQKLVNPESIIHYGGLVLLFLVIFAENGVFFCFFLPGDSLLFTAGLLCATGILDSPIEIVMLNIGAGSVLGYFFGYYFGHKTGKALMKRPDSLFFKKKHIELARTYYEKYGGKTLVIGRFLPIVRTFAPILAGIISMEMKRFLLFNISGAVLWTFVVVNAGYLAGTYVPNIRDYLWVVIVLMIIFTSIPIASALRKRNRSRA